MWLEALSRRPGFEQLDIVLLGSGETLERSWCFWEANVPAPYCDMVERTWTQMSVVSSPFAERHTLHHRPYHYLPGPAFFDFFKREFLPRYPHIRYLIAPVTAVAGEPGHFTVHTTQGTFHAQEVYNSGYMHQRPRVDMWQHFRGWFVEFKTPLADCETAVLMDFDLPQDRGCSFMYVLPISPHTALVEYTFFGGELWEPRVYEAELQAYLARRYGTGYRILRTESGKIPMQQAVFTPTGPCGEVNLGTVGGLVKAGTGYAFDRIRRDSEALAEARHKGIAAQRALSPARFEWYDSLLLWIIRHHPEACKGIFTRLFTRHAMEKVTRFMDEKTSLWEELLIFASLPKAIFLRALVARLKPVRDNHPAVEPALHRI